MAKYRVLSKTFINNALREEGEIVEWDGKPGSTLEPVKERGRPKAEPAPAVPEIDTTFDD